MNRMNEIAKMLGVELNEEFGIKNHNSIRYRLSEMGVEYLDHIHQWRTSSDVNRLLCGIYEIEKLPWCPKDGEHYFYPDFELISCINSSNWRGTPADIRRKDRVGVYRTSDEVTAKVTELGWL